MTIIERQELPGQPIDTQHISVIEQEAHWLQTMGSSRVANDSYDNEILNNQDEHYQETTIEISAIKDIDLFKQTGCK